jgi:two-component system sensor histidine kinase UhpB
MLLFFLIMEERDGFFTLIWRRINYLPILQRVLVANSVVIIIGAVAGTLLTRQLALIGNFRLILLFSSLGILLSLLVNYRIVKASLWPLRELRNNILKLHTGQTSIPESPLMQADPNIHSLIVAMNDTLRRLEIHSSQLRALSERSINMQEEERKRIARTLHDDTSQTVSTILLQLERLETELPEERTDLKQRLMSTRKIASDMLEELRKNIWDLRPTILDDLGLVPAIRWYARMRLEAIGVQVNFDLDEHIRFEPYLETLLFRISQEAVANVLRHAQADKVDLRLKMDQFRICFEVHDNGRGFNVEKTVEEAVSRKQLGLLGIQERASLVGGEVRIDSLPGQGTCLQVLIPLLSDQQIRMSEKPTDLVEAKK